MFRKISLIVLCLVLIGWSFYPGGSYRERECEICSKQIWLWGKDSYVYDNMGISTSGAYWHEDRAEEMGMDMQILVCKECKEKYNTEHRQILLDAYKKWIEEKHRENKELILKNRQETKQKKIDGINKEIEKAKQKLRNLE